MFHGSSDVNHSFRDNQRRGFVRMLALWHKYWISRKRFDSWLNCRQFNCRYWCCRGCRLYRSNVEYLKQFSLYLEWLAWWYYFASWANSTEQRLWELRGYKTLLTEVWWWSLPWNWRLVGWNDVSHVNTLTSTIRYRITYFKSRHLGPNYHFCSKRICWYRRW